MFSFDVKICEVRQALHSDFSGATRKLLLVYETRIGCNCYSVYFHKSAVCSVRTSWMGLLISTGFPKKTTESVVVDVMQQLNQELNHSFSVSCQEACSRNDTYNQTDLGLLTWSNS